MTSTLHIHLLGEFLLVSGDTPVTTIDWPRLQSLLAYLVLHHDTPQSRTHLAFLLWPDSTEEQAHTNLRHLVYRLRHALPNANFYLHANKHMLHWHPDGPWTLDVAEFERAIAQAEQTGEQSAMRLALEEAVKLYRGDLLPGGYEEWLLYERERLRQQFLNALERLALLLEKERQYQDAIRVAQRLLRHDPLHEATYRHLMRLYAASGDKAAALRTYHTCVSVLERELAMEPNPPTQEAYQRLLQKEASLIPLTPPTTTLIGVATLVGRQLEWARLQNVWQLAGQPRMMILSGEAGIGKTRLIEEFLAWIDRQGMGTATAYCYPAEGELAYSPITSWLRAEAIKPTLATLADTWLTEIARFVPEVLEKRPDLSPPGPLLESWQRQRLFEALARAICNARQPLFLLLEDLHWCDRETLEWLHYILRFDPKAHILIVGTLRPEEVIASHPLASLLKMLKSKGQAAELRLGPLNAEETASLATQIAGRHLDQQTTTDLYQETEGNPLFIVETMRMSEGIGKGGNHSALSNANDMSSTIHAVISARLEHLSPLSHELMSLAAVLGRAFTFSVLKHASGLEEDSLVQGLDELWQRRIIREQGIDAYDFSHDKLRLIAYSALSSARRRLLHRRVAESLEAVYTDSLDAVSGFIAAHYEQAGVIKCAITYYQRTAEGAQRVYANADAILSYQKILILLNLPLSLPQEQRQETAIHVYKSLGEIFSLIGQFDDARKTYQDALMQISAHDRIQQAHLHRSIALTWKTQRHFEKALQVYKAAEVALERTSGERTSEWWQAWIDIQSDCIEIYYWLARLKEMTELVEKARPIVERYGTHVQRASFFQSLFMMSIRNERYSVSQETLEYARWSLAAHLELENATAIAWARFNLGFAYLWYGDLDLAEEHLQATQVQSKKTGDKTLQSRNLIYLTMLSRKRGQIDETRQYALQALAVSAELQFPEYIAMAKANLAWVAWREKKLPLVQSEGLAALQLWQSLESAYMFCWAGLWPLIAVELTLDRCAEALKHARLLLDPQQSVLPKELNALVAAAIQLWDAEQFEAAYAHLRQAVVVAQEVGYL